MKNFLNQNFFAILGFILICYFLFYQKPEDSKEIQEQKQHIEQLEVKIDVLNDLILARKDTVQIIEQHKNYITNKYYNESKQVDSVNNIDSLRTIIRGQMLRLGEPRFYLLGTGSTTVK